MGVDKDALRCASRVSQTFSFEDWVAANSSQLIRYANVIGHHADAPDAAQDALAAVFVRWKQFDSLDHAMAYARRVILNSNVSRWRRWTRRVVLVGAGSVLEEIATEESYLDDINLVSARRLLAMLTAPQRAAVYLRFYEDMTYKQISETIGCREVTARSHVHRALEQLKQEIQRSEAL